MAQGVRGQVRPVVWSVFDVMEAWDKMPYAHIKMVIANKGGFIDDKGIIHKGTATVVVGTID